MMLVHFLDVMRTRTNLSDATAVPVVTSSGDERFEFSSTYTFMFNSSRNYSLNWRHIVMNLHHSVYYYSVNNILKHEGDILHVWSYCNVILMALSDRDEAMYISLIDFQWTSIETKSFQQFNNSLFDYDYLHQLWKYICYICTKMYWYCSTLNRSTLCTVSGGIWNTDYTGLKWSYINQFW